MLRCPIAAHATLALAAGGDDPPTDPPVTEITGCDGAKLLSKPSDPDRPGPWPVGARTVAVGRLGKVEVWYPAVRGSEGTLAKARYDIRPALNPLQRDLVPDADNPWQDCDCYRDLPLDDAHGPYPAVVFVHGTASFRHQSLTQVTHWASRGFVVIAADHPGLLLGDILTMVCPDTPTGPRDLAGDVAALIAALGAPAGDLAFLAGHVDATRLAVAGHSAGAGAAAAASGQPGVRVVLGFAGNQPAADTATLERVLFMAANRDNVVAPTATRAAWMMSATPRHYVTINGSGHLAFSDLCETKNAAGQNLLQVGEQYQLCGVAAAGILFDCNPAFIPAADSRDIIDFASTTVLESTLQCATTGPTIDRVDDTYDRVEVYEEAL
jgi:predicted dienelactone hydrolase